MMITVTMTKMNVVIALFLELSHGVSSIRWLDGLANWIK
jgi:hypothetical protein